MFGGRQRCITLLSQAILISSRLLCEWWPFRKRSTGAVSVSWATAHRNSLVNYDRKTEVREVSKGSSMRTNASFLPPHSTTVCHASHHRLVRRSNSVDLITGERHNLDMQGPLDMGYGLT